MGDQLHWQVMYEKYEANLNIDGTGAIVAAPDLETPGRERISLERMFVKQEEATTIIG